MKIRPVGRIVLCRRTDGQTERRTDVTKLIVTFRYFAHIPNNEKQ